MPAQTQVIASGKGTYRLQIPYKLIETGAPGAAKPFIIWLHGFGQTAGWMQMHFESVWNRVEAYHFFVQAPYVLLESYIQKKPEGYSWYMFNGEKERYVESMEHAAEFLLDQVSKMRPIVNATEIWVCGYSQGAYLSGYLALSRPKIIARSYMINGRFKDEWVKDWDAMHETKLIGIHGLSDTEVQPEPQQHALEEASFHGIDARFYPVEGTHKVNNAMLDKLFELLSPNF